jgi:hypothetical protein
MEKQHSEAINKWPQYYDSKQIIRAWKMIYILMDDVKNFMDEKYKDKNEQISNHDIEDVIEYLNNALKNIMKNTIEYKVK